MLGYGRYWTAGFSAHQWVGMFQKLNVSEFDFINIGIERDRVCGSLDLWFHVMGLRTWMSVAVGEPSEVFLKALNEIIEVKKNG